MDEPFDGFEEAWVLLSLFLAGGKPEHVIANADALNHATPIPEQWERACASLGTRGLIRAGEPFPTLTPEGAALVVEARAASIRFYDQFDEVAARVSEVPARFEAVDPPTKAAIEDSQRWWGAKAQEILAESARKRAVRDGHD